MQQVGHAILITRELLLQIFEILSFVTLGRTSDRIGIEAIDQAGGRRWIVVHSRSDTADVIERDSVETAARIDGYATLCRAQLSRAVEMLHTETHRIGDLVTTGTGGLQRMHSKAFASRVRW